MITDPVADMLTRIRNANKVKVEKVSFNFSAEKKAIVDILLREGYIAAVKVEGGVKKTIVVTLKYTADGGRVLTDLKRISKPGLRVYASVDELPEVLNGLGMAIVSTSKGVLTDKEARKADVGGEVLAYVW
ncbi:MAG: 30S ribosomal protein S8 [Bacilli bacterium]|jgi:small subunit ribosomal protein S8|nr:30S ribosomal protein S8 [Bacilli bacterium]